MSTAGRPQVLALCGSLAAQSVNRSLLRWLAVEVAASLDVQEFDALGDLPLFNPDLLAAPPPAVDRFKVALAAAAGLVICTPEYALGPPGALKNALDWTVGTSDLSGKPALLVTAASLGERAHASLLGTLQVLEARIDESTQVHIPFAKARIAADGVPHAATQAPLRIALQHFIRRVLEAAG